MVIGGTACFSVIAGMDIMLKGMGFRGRYAIHFSYNHRCCLLHSGVRIRVNLLSV
jgi:hypothetical protein